MEVNVRYNALVSVNVSKNIEVETLGMIKKQVLHPFNDYFWMTKLQRRHFPFSSTWLIMLQNNAHIYFFYSSELLWVIYVPSDRQSLSSLFQAFSLFTSVWPPTLPRYFSHTSLFSLNVQDFRSQSLPVILPAQTRPVLLIDEGLWRKLFYHILHFNSLSYFFVFISH